MLEDARADVARTSDNSTAVHFCCSLFACVVSLCYTMCTCFICPFPVTVVKELLLKTTSSPVTSPVTSSQRDGIQQSPGNEIERASQYSILWSDYIRNRPDQEILAPALIS